MLTKHRLPRTSVTAVGAALMLTLAVAPPATASAAGHGWTRLRPAVPSVPRAAMTMAYDPGSRSLVTFGGYDQTGAYLDQTWLWDGIDWNQPSVQTPPSARAAAGMAYDSVTRQLVLFGGYDGAAHLGDTWTWDGSALAWTHRQTATKPPGVSGPMMFTDPLNGHADLVGGFDGQLFHSTTWQWTGSDWKKLTPATQLTARGAAIAELDRATHSVVVFGGLGSLRVDDTWTWDGVDWTQQAPAHQPPSRFYSASAYSPALRAVVIFGGASAIGDLDDTWTWDGTDWSELTPAASPRPRESHAMAYDRSTHQIILFGGMVQGQVVRETWQLA